MDNEPTGANEDELATSALPETKQPLTLTVDVREVGACQRHVSVSISREDIDRYFQLQFDELAPKAEVPGFRPGRAPRKLVESKFRRQITDQVKGSLIMDALSQLVDQQHFAAISEPDLNYESVNIPDEGPLTFEFNIEVRPNFEVPAWKGLELEVPEVEVADSEIDELVEQYQTSMSDTAPVKDPVQAGDTVAFNVRVTHDGRTVRNYEDVELKVRPTLTFHDAELGGFDTLVAGASVGDRRSASVKVTNEDDAASSVEHTVDVEFEVLDVKRQQSISADELATKLEFESIDALRTAVSASLARRKEYERRHEIRKAISAMLTESANWELPPSLLKRQARRELERAVIELQSSGFSEEEIRTRENAMRRNAQRRTEVALKEHFILERIAEVEKIEDTPEDYDLEIARIANSTGESERRVRSKLERGGQMDALRNMIIEQKVIDLITQHAVFRTKAKAAKTVESDAADTVTAAPFGLWSEPETSIPEAKYDENPAARTPGQPAVANPAGFQRG